MAYIDQKHKALIAAELKKFMPKSWKYSLRIRHNSQLVMTITKANFNLIDGLDCDHTELQANIHALSRRFNKNSIVYDVMSKVIDTLNIGNHDRSDSQRDYFDVGFYTLIKIGDYDKPFTVSE